jgi:hypothetical protein
LFAKTRIVAPKDNIGGKWHPRKFAQYILSWFQVRSNFSTRIRSCSWRIASKAQPTRLSGDEMDERKKLQTKFSVWYFVAAIALLVVFQTMIYGPMVTSRQEVTYDEFRKHLSDKQITEVTIKTIASSTNKKTARTKKPFTTLCDSMTPS